MSAKQPFAVVNVNRGVGGKPTLGFQTRTDAEEAQKLVSGVRLLTILPSENLTIF
jgi:hypothetical protein